MEHLPEQLDKIITAIAELKEELTLDLKEVNEITNPTKVSTETQTIRRRVIIDIENHPDFNRFHDHED